MTQHAQGISRLAFGTVAGFAGTLAIQVFMTANQKWFPSAAPPIRQDPGEFMVESVEAVLPVAVRERIPEAMKNGAPWPHATRLAAAATAGHGCGCGARCVRYRDGRSLSLAARVGVRVASHQTA